MNFLDVPKEAIINPHIYFYFTVWLMAKNQYLLIQFLESHSVTAFISVNNGVGSSVLSVLKCCNPNVNLSKSGLGFGNAVRPWDIS